MDSTDRLIIVSDGVRTYLFMNGKVYGKHVSGIRFQHLAGEHPEIEIIADKLPLDSAMNTDDFQRILDSVLKEQKESPALSEDCEAPIPKLKD